MSSLPLSNWLGHGSPDSAVLVLSDISFIDNISISIIFLSIIFQMGCLMVLVTLLSSCSMILYFISVLSIIFH